MPALQIGGLTMPAPDINSMDIIYQDLDSENTGRGEETGIMIRERVRSNVRKFVPVWSVLKGSDLTTIMSAIADETFTVTILDPRTGASSTMSMYAGDRSIKCLLPTASFATSLYQASFALTEC